MTPELMLLCLVVGYFLSWLWDELGISAELRFRYTLWRRWRR